MTQRATLVASLALCFPASLHAQAEAEREEVWLVSLSPVGVVFPVSEPQRSWFGPGLVGSLSLHRSLAPAVLVGVHARTGFLFDGPAPSIDSGFADPGFGTFTQASLVLRLRPFASGDDVRRGTGFWLEAGGGVTFTGNVDVRGAWELALGYAFQVGVADVGPSLRFAHVIQPSNQLVDEDAHLLSLGLDITFGDAREAPPDEALPEDEGPGDRDRDGILDPDDECPTEPEDRDDFEDEDGCPDEDNDADGILDQLDSCPMEPEDMDGFEDDDGCPDPDNDGDGFLDEVDGCPDEAEIVNGVDDDDGCPDEGLIELVNDRIILEERVLFDFERARVKHAARPVIQAIVTLVSQHPEWARMRVEGHADVRGDRGYNQRLSERRAHNVMRALVAEGLDETRIDSAGYGSTRPRDMARTEAAHQRNRRVEFVVIERRLDEAEAETDAPDDPHMVFEAGETDADAADRVSPETDHGQDADAENADAENADADEQDAEGQDAEEDGQDAVENEGGGSRNDEDADMVFKSGEGR